MEPNHRHIKKSLKQLLSFGLPFQASSFLALFKDDLIILFLGKILGFEALGYIGWAKKWAEAPIRIIMDNISRVLFPVISRIQNDKAQIGKVIDRILYYQTLILAPTLITMTMFMPILVFIIPKYDKWAPALPLFYVFCLASLFSSYSSPFMNLFNALGKVKISFTLMFVWDRHHMDPYPLIYSLVWILWVLLCSFNYCLILFSRVFYCKKIYFFSFFKSIYQSLLSTVCMGIVLYIVMPLTYYLGYLGLALSALSGALTYYLVLLLLFKINLIKELQSLFVK